jgi:putative phosphoesterase
MRAAIIADTHLPRGPRALPPACVERLQTAEVIIHAGDLTALSVLEELRAYGPVVAVYGNVDEPAVRDVLPAAAELDLEGSRIAVIHDAGRRSGRLEHLRRMFPHSHAVVFGHSHLPLHSTADDGFQIFNPGSPTDKRRARHHTMGIASVDRGRLTFELVDLD